MFKAKYIYKNYAFSIFDHTTMRKKTHQNELDGWKHDGWALASGYSSFVISSMALKTNTFFDLKTCLRSKAPDSTRGQGKATYSSSMATIVPSQASSQLYLVATKQILQNKHNFSCHMWP